jgi:hypothetical protein
MRRVIKNLLRKAGHSLVVPHLYPPAPDRRDSPDVKLQLAGWYSELRARARGGLPIPSIRDVGVRIYSQFEEDGYLLYLAAVLELSPTTFVEIGSDNGINSNCANLAINLGWHGVFIDGNAEAIAQGRLHYASHPDTWLYPPKFLQSLVTAENINDLLAQAGFSGAVGICSIDIDGNDCWIWNALTAIDPAVVIIETHIEYGMRNIAVPYDANYSYPGKHADYNGASPLAMVELAHRKGYRLVGANRYGFNFIFVKRDLFPERVPEVDVTTVLGHPRYVERLAVFDAVSGFEFIEAPFRGEGRT